MVATMTEEEMALLKELALKEKALDDRLRRLEMMIEKILLAMGISPH